MNAEEKVGIDEHAFKSELDSIIEGVAIAPSVVEELQQRGDVRLRHGPSVGEPSQARENLCRAGMVFRCSLGLADENRAAAGSVLGGSGSLIRSPNLHPSHVRVVHV